MPKFTDENIVKIEKWKSYIDNGHYGNSKDIVDTYNEVFEGEKQKQAYTSCGSCLRRCVMTMYNALQEYNSTKEVLEVTTVDEPTVEDAKEEITVETPKSSKKKS